MTPIREKLAAAQIAVHGKKMAAAGCRALQSRAGADLACAEINYTLHTDRSAYASNHDREEMD